MSTTKSSNLKKITCFLFLAILLSGVAAATAAEKKSTAFKETLKPIGHCISGEKLYRRSLTVSSDSKHLAYISSIGEDFRVWRDGEAGKAYRNITRGSPFFSPQKNRLAYIVRDNGHMFVVIDGQKGKKYAKVDTLRFSPDGSRVAYRAENKKGEQFVVTDKKEGPHFSTGITKEIGIVFSPDSSQVAYVGINEHDSHILVKNHKKLYSYDHISEIKFSPDSRHLAFIAQKDKKWMVVRDGEEGEEYKKISDLIFSPDSKHLAYTAIKGGKMIVVKDSQTFSEGKFTIKPRFSPDGSRLAYVSINKDKKARYIIDGKKGMLMDQPGKLYFSKDSAHAAYPAQIGDKWHLVADGEKGPGFKEITYFAYSPYSSDFVYRAAKENDKACMVVNQKPHKAYNNVARAPIFSPDEKSLAYVAIDKGKMFMVVNGQEKTPCPAIGIPQTTNTGATSFTTQLPFFSPSGKRMAYPAYSIEDKKAWMVVDGRSHQHFEKVGKPYFSPDGKHIAYVAAQKNDKTTIVVDGQPGEKQFDGIISGADLTFEADNRFYLLVVRESDPGPSFYRLEVEITDTASPAENG